MKFIQYPVFLALFLLLPVDGRRLGEHDKVTAAQNKIPGRAMNPSQMWMAKREGMPRHMRNMKIRTPPPPPPPLQSTTTGHQQHKQKQRYRANDKQAKQQQQQQQQDGNVKHASGGDVTVGEAADHEMPETTNCGTFLIRQTKGLVIYDDFEKSQDSNNDNNNGLLCQRTTQDGKQELCLGGDDDDEAFLVQGKCRRGFGYTTVALSNSNNDNKDDDDETSLVFACEKSELAKPLARCTCTFGNDTPENVKPCNGETDVTFRAEARFGFVTLKGNNNMLAHCTLSCKMPTTNE